MGPSLHPALREAIDAGWEGLTFVEGDDPFDPLTLLCSCAHGHAIVRSGPVLTVRLLRSGPTAPPTVLLTVAGGGDEAHRSASLGVDLAYAGGRELALRMAGDEVLRVVVAVPDRTGSPALLPARVSLREPARDLLRVGAAIGGEWACEDPPPRVDPLEAEERLPRLVPCREAPGVALQVPLSRLPSLAARQGGRPLLRRGRAGDVPALVLAGPSSEDGLLVLEDPAQRALAAECARRGRLLLVGAIPGDESFITWMEIVLTGRERSALLGAALVDPPGAA